MTTATYPKRPAFFAHRFCRVMAKVCLANEVGPAVCWMLTVIAQTEDAAHYRRPVTYFNGQLASVCGFTEKQLERARAKAIRAGWLHCTPGRRGVAPAYWVVIPPHAQDLDDAPTDEGTEPLCATAGSVGDQSGGETGINRGEKRGSIGGRNAEPMGELSSLSLTLENQESASQTGAASPPPDATNGPPAAPAKKPRKEPTGPHHEAIRSFCSKWQARYGCSYPFNAGKDAAAVKFVLGQVGGDVARFGAVVDRYLADGDPFYADDRHSLGILRAKLARWLVAAPSVRPPPRAGSTRGEQLEDYILGQMTGLDGAA